MWGGRKGKGGGKQHLSVSGSTYVGATLNGKRHGQGKETYAVGGSYSGEFKEDLRHGNGEMVFATGAVYQGEWHADQQHGRGKFRFENGAAPLICASQRERCGPMSD